MFCFCQKSLKDQGHEGVIDLFFFQKPFQHGCKVLNLLQPFWQDLKWITINSIFNIEILLPCFAEVIKKINISNVSEQQWYYEHINELFEGR